MNVPTIWGPLFEVLGCDFRVFRSRSASKVEKEQLRYRRRATVRETCREIGSNNMDTLITVLENEGKCTLKNNRW